MGDEMILELAAKLQGFDKTAAKKDDDKKDDKKDDKDEKKGGCPGCDGKLVFGKCYNEDCSKCAKKDKKDDDKKDDKKKKDASVMTVLAGLSKLAEELDDVGADDAAAAVDDALRIIVENLQAEE